MSNQAAAFAAYTAIIDGDWDDYLPSLLTAIRARNIELNRIHADQKVTIR